MIQYYAERIRNGLMTVPEHSVFFWSAAVNTSNTAVDPARYRDLATLLIIRECDGFYLVFLNPAESGDVTYDRLTGGKFKYDSFHDLDRYLLKCRFGNMECDKCPAWKKLREILAVAGTDLSSAMGDRRVVRFEDDPAYGEVGKAYVGYGNGEVGPIARKPYDGRWNPFAPLELVCSTCEIQRLPRDVKSVTGNEKVFIRSSVLPSSVHDRNGNANDADDDRHKDTGKGNDVAYAHGGIIAFFKRLLGRGRKS